MADDAAKSLFIDIDWNLEVDKIDSANESSDKLKTNAEEITKNTKKSAKQVNTSAAQMTKDYKKTGGAANDTALEVENIGNEAEVSEDKVNRLGDTMKGVATASAAAFAAVGASVVALGKKAFDAAKDQQNFVKTIAVGTGATGEALDGLIDSFENVGRNTTQPLEDVANGISTINTLLGYEGEELENFTSKNLMLQQITGESIDSLSVATSDLINKWDLTATMGEKTLDKLLVASQATNVPVTTLAATVADYGSELQSLGFEIFESIALLGQWEKQGYDAQTMIKGLTTAQKQMVSEGIDDMAMGLDIAIDKIKNAETETEALTLATEAFGAQAAADFSAAIRSGVLDVDDLVAAMYEAEGAIEDTAAATMTFDDKLQLMKNNVHFALLEIGETLLDAVMGIFDSILPMIEPLAELLGDTFSQLMPSIQGLIEGIGPVLGTAIELIADIGPPITEAIIEIVEAIGPLVDIVFELASELLPVIAKAIATVVPIISKLIKAIQPLISKILPPLGKLIEMVSDVFFGLVDPIMDIVDAVLPPLIDIFSVVIDSIMPPLISIFDTFIQQVLPPLSGVIGIIVEALSPLINLLTSLFETVIPPVISIVGVLSNVLLDSLGVAFKQIGTIVNTVKDVFSGLISFIQNVFTGNWSSAWQDVVGIFGSVFDGIRDFFKVPINWIIEKLNLFLEGLNGIQIPDWVPVVGGKGFDISPIPMLAEGTDFFEGGKAIVGELGPELVELPRGSKVTPADETARLLTPAQNADFDYLLNETGAGNTINENTTIEVQMNFDVDASGADDSAVERLRTELRAEMPRAVEKVFRVLFMQNKPA